MKTILTLILTMTLSYAACQITTIDAVKAKSEYEREAIYFFENNWKPFREAALEEKVISGFELVKSDPDSTGVTTIWLVTHYQDTPTYENAEKNFQGIIRRISPGGPKMLNAVPRKEFIISVESYHGKTLAWKP